MNTEMAGYHKFADENLEPYGSFEVFWTDGSKVYSEEGVQPGWYWQACFPGCSDSEPIGPFETSTLAYIDAQGD